MTYLIIFAVLWLALGVYVAGNGIAWLNLAHPDLPRRKDSTCGLEVMAGLITFIVHVMWTYEQWNKTKSLPLGYSARSWHKWW